MKHLVYPPHWTHIGLVGAPSHFSAAANSYAEQYAATCAEGLLHALTLIAESEASQEQSEYCREIARAAIAKATRKS
jgi:hypothetical protein